jgi:hypothetical protein
VKNLERFSLVVQSITRLALTKFQQLPDHLLQEQQQQQQEEQQQQQPDEPRPPDPDAAWGLEDVEKLVSYLSRLDILFKILYFDLCRSTTGIQSSPITVSVCKHCKA